MKIIDKFILYIDKKQFCPTTEDLENEELAKLAKRLKGNSEKETLTNILEWQEKVYGNVCVNCGAYQGNWFVWKESLEIAYESSKIAEKRKLKIILTEQERLERVFPEEILKLEKHHISYNPEETIFVCRSYHLRIHNTDDFPHLKPKD